MYCPPRRIDEMKGAIESYGKRNISIRLYGEDGQFMIRLRRAIFERGKVDVRKGEGFYFWIEKIRRREVPCVAPLPTKELTAEDWRGIDERINALLED